MAPGKTALVTVLAVLVATLALPVVAVMALFDHGDLGFGPPTLDLADTGPIAAAAYEQAATAAREFEPACEVPAWLLAGIGEIESGHGTHGGATITASGDVRPPIIGIPLPGLGPDTDGGVWDGSAAVDHAVGPMQFIPATWSAYGQDGNDDGVADPHNIYDAALAAAAYLCASAPPMASEAQWREGLLTYNHSEAYVDDVLTAGRQHQASTPTDRPSDDVQLVDVPGIGLTNASWAHQVRALLIAAAADGVTLTGSSYRDRARQIELRRQHCGATHEAIYQWPASSCAPPTARPGESLHEQGLAIDFDSCSITTTCWRWLNTNAITFGLHPLASEPWHWSFTGG